MLGLPAEFGFDSTTFLPIVGTSTFWRRRRHGVELHRKGPSLHPDLRHVDRGGAEPRQSQPETVHRGALRRVQLRRPSTPRGPRTSLKSEKGTNVGPPTPSGPRGAHSAE